VKICNKNIASETNTFHISYVEKISRYTRLKFLSPSGPTEIDSSVLLEHGGSFNDRFEVLEELGKGRFGVVRKVVDRESGVVLAAKIIKCRKAADKDKVKEEIAIMEDLKHPKLLLLATYFEEPREMIMVTE
jgi:serine/threonine protein kinase